MLYKKLIKNKFQIYKINLILDVTQLLFFFIVLFCFCTLLSNIGQFVSLKLFQKFIWFMLYKFENSN